MYKLLVRPFLFFFDPEKIHHFSFRFLKTAAPLGGIMRGLYSHHDSSLETQCFGLTFKNPVGLAAGFDKDALIAEKWQNLGFGFVELGTVTPRPQAGNPKKRLFRLPQDQAIINRMGFNNQGVDVMVERLKKIKRGDLIVGANIGKNKDTPNENAVDDYLICFEKLFPYVDYFVVNVSSPNTPGLRSLQEKEPLTHLLQTLQDKNQAQPAPKPLLLKIAPDLNEAELDDIIEVAQTTNLAGLIATNTTISREGLTTPDAEVEKIGNGGLSGKPLTQRSNEVIRYIHQKTDGKIPLIGVGGIMRPEDAAQRLESGASLVQVYTGFVYNGPGFVKKILQFLTDNR